MTDANIYANNTCNLDLFKYILLDVFPDYIPIEFINSANFASAGNKENLRLSYGQFFTGDELTEFKRIEIGERIRDMVYDSEKKEVVLFLENTASIGILKTN
mgnify:CR=1 FL=1